MPTKQPTIIQQDWSRGMRRSRSRDAIGANAAWRIKDFIINRLGAPIAKRGGWTYAGSTFSGSPGRVRAMVDGPFNGGHYILAVDSAGAVYRSTNSIGSPPATWATDGTTKTVTGLKQNPIFYLDTIVFPANGPTGNLYQANENTVTDYAEMTGVTHRPQYMTIWKNRMVGGGEEFIVFGPPIGVTGTLSGNNWDEDATYGVSQPVKGLHEMRGAILIFYDGFIQRIRGTTPAGYGVTDDDLVFEDLFAGVGCIDAFSITEWNDMVIWVDRRGIYMSDGAAPIDLTKFGDIKDYFTDYMRSWTSNWRVASGVFDDLLFVSITDISAHTHLKTFVCDLPTRVWVEFDNFPFTCYALDRKDRDELHGGLETVAGKAVKISPIMTPTTGNMADANGTNVLPMIETAYGRYAAGPTRLVDLYVGYEIDTAGVSGPGVLKVDYTKEPAGSPSYSSFGDGTESIGAGDLHGATGNAYRRKRISVREEGPGLSLRIAQSGPSAETKLYNIAGTLIPLSGIRDY